MMWLVGAAGWIAVGLIIGPLIGKSIKLADRRSLGCSRRTDD